MKPLKTTLKHAVMMFFHRFQPGMKIFAQQSPESSLSAL